MTPITYPESPRRQTAVAIMTALCLSLLATVLPSCALEDGEPGIQLTVEPNPTPVVPAPYVPSPELVLSPALVDFGVLGVGEWAAQPVSVRNAGDLAMYVTGLKMAGDPAYELKSPIGLPHMLLPGAELHLTLRFTATTPGAPGGALIVETTGGNGLISLHGGALATCAEVDTSAITFGATPLGSSATTPVTIDNCGGAPLTIHSASLVFESESYTLDAGELPVVLTAGEAWTVEVTYAPSVGTGGEVELLRIVTNAPGATTDVPIAAAPIAPPPTTCPIAVGGVLEGTEVAPLTVLHLTSESASEAGVPIVGWSWSVEAPTGSQAIFYPSAHIAEPSFHPQVAGDYVFTLTVTDANGLESCASWQETVSVVPSQAIYVELLWQTPGDDVETDTGPGLGADLDLHFAHGQYAGGSDGDGDGEPDPWFDALFDCFWFAANQNWGDFDPTIDDDPVLLRDDTDGAGPEIIALGEPEETTYRVGVHYWQSNGFGISYATLRIYLDGKLHLSVADVPMEQGAMWDAAIIDATTGSIEIPTDDDGALAIAPFQSPFFTP